MAEFLPLWLFAGVCVFLMLGYPVAFSLGGTALLFAAGGAMFGTFDAVFLEALPNRLFGIVRNDTLIAVPLFVLMGVLLEKSKLAERLLDTMAMLFGTMRGGLGISVILVGMLLAASTGIVGATVVTMGMISLPTMLRRGYDPALATGTICATGTLGQIIPPSIALVLLGDVMSNAFQKAQLQMGVFSPKTVSVGDLFVGAIVPGLLLVVLYIAYVAGVAWLQPHKAPAVPKEELRQGMDDSSLFMEIVKGLLPPLLLIMAVLGSILGGLATPTEAAGVGAFGAAILAFASGKLSKNTLKECVQTTTKVTGMVFMILIGASLFSLVFRGFGGEELIHEFFNQLPGGVFSAVLIVMIVMFFLGFILDFIEITFVVVPIVAPVLLAMGLDPIWLGIMMAINLQTSFLTPPFGFALFYLRGVAPAEVRTQSIYKGVIPFILIQLFVLILLSVWPDLATWLPETIYAD